MALMLYDVDLAHSELINFHKSTHMLLLMLYCRADFDGQLNKYFLLEHENYLGSFMFKNSFCYNIIISAP